MPGPDTASTGARRREQSDTGPDAGPDTRSERVPGPDAESERADTESAESESERVPGPDTESAAGARHREHRRSTQRAVRHRAPGPDAESASPDTESAGADTRSERVPGPDAESALTRRNEREGAGERRESAGPRHGERQAATPSALGECRGPFLPAACFQFFVCQLIDMLDAP